MRQTFNINSNIEVEIQGDKKQAFVSLLLELQEIVSETIQNILDHYGKKQIEPSNWVAIVILKRLIESTKAGTLLISHNFDRDAAILMTCLIELRLDMQYISLNHMKAQEWINHTESSKKPWKVGMLLKEIFKNKDEEYEAERKVYMQFSMVKHGNPVAETFAFPLAISNNSLVMPPQEDILLSKFSLFIFSFFTELFRSFKTAAIDFKRCGFDIEEFETKADFINIAMSDIQSKNINEQICLLRKITPIPELCKSCVVVPKNHIEFTCLIRQKDSTNNFSCEKYKSK